MANIQGTKIRNTKNRARATQVFVNRKKRADRKACRGKTFSN